MTEHTPLRDGFQKDNTSEGLSDQSPVAAANREFWSWSDGQEQAYLELIEVADAFFEQDWGTTGLRPRLDSLVVGATGTGKSHLVRMISRQLGLPRLRLSFSEWIPMGARERPPTLERVNEFVVENVRGIIHLDELDKFRATNTGDWSTSVLTELFLLLDRSLQQKGKNFQWSQRLQERLASSFLLLGSGTWQSIWDQRARTPLGFHTNTDSFSTPLYREIQRSGVIPKELLLRFSSQLIVLPLPSPEDYRRAALRYGLTQIAKELGLTLDYEAAVEGGLGARWLEESMASLFQTIQRNPSVPLVPLLIDLRQITEGLRRALRRLIPAFEVGSTG